MTDDPTPQPAHPPNRSRSSATARRLPPPRATRTWQAAAGLVDAPPVSAAPCRGGHRASRRPACFRSLRLRSSAASSPAACRRRRSRTRCGRPRPCLPARAPTRARARQTVHVDESSAVITATDKVMPAVVTIDSSSSGAPRPDAAGIGSGFIFDANGWILTNQHVVDGADTLNVQLNDGSHLPRHRLRHRHAHRPRDRQDRRQRPADGAARRLSATSSPASWRSRSATRSASSEHGHDGVVSGSGRQIRPATRPDQLRARSTTSSRPMRRSTPATPAGRCVNSAARSSASTPRSRRTRRASASRSRSTSPSRSSSRRSTASSSSGPGSASYYMPVTQQIAKDSTSTSTTACWVSARPSGQPAVFADSPAAKAGHQGRRHHRRGRRPADRCAARPVGGDHPAHAGRQDHPPHPATATRRARSPSRSARCRSSSVLAQRARRTVASTVSNAPGNGAFGLRTRTSSRHSRVGREHVVGDRRGERLDEAEAVRLHPRPRRARRRAL